MTYLVTGASGFVGRHLIRHLAHGKHRVVGVVRRPGAVEDELATEVVADLFDPDATQVAIAGAAPTVVFHLAAAQSGVGRSWGDPGRTIGGNLLSAVNVLSAARACDTPPRVLVVSSSEIFGEVDEKSLPLGEDAPSSPKSPYALSKAVTEQAAAFYAAELDLPVIIARAFNHIGPGQTTSFVIPSFAAQVAEAERSGGGAIRVGNLSARRDFTDVRDVVRAYTILAEAGRPGETYHVGSGRMRSIGELLELLLKQSTADIEVVPDPNRWRPNDTPAVCADATRITALGWKPEIQIDETLADVLSEARRLAAT